ncbi:MAG: NAD(P)/FAD-dependent oxidoreductase [Alphaproteobacteria bacterium]|nr:NAD(P)/FAD-dependent oxidoreductase [Alphaproteobacteria bacterium]
MTMMLKPDLCVLGAGSGGLVVAAGAAQMGARVVLLEPHKMGGDCLNYGCVPSKTLLAAAAHHPRPSYAEAMARVQAAIATIAPNDSQERFEGLGVTVLREAGRFRDQRTLETESGTRIRARRFVVATGSQPRIPDLPGLAEVPFLTNETLWDLRAAPAHLLILGGGPIGCEMALAHVRLGSRVTLIQRHTLLPRDDPDGVAVVRRRLAAEGVDIRERVDASAAERTDAGVRLTLSDGNTVEGSHLLVAVGRRATVDGLGLEAAGVPLERGAIRTDAGMRTGNRRVFAVGDVAGGPQFTHAAGYQAGVVLKRALFFLPAKADPGLIPWVTYTDPELAQVGLTEATARKRFGDAAVRVLAWPFAENDRAIATGRTDGLVKVVATRRGRVLGCSIAGPQAGELILPWCLAIQNRLKIGAMAQVIAPYPTLSEAWKRAAGSFYSDSLFSPRTRRIVGWLQRLP